MPSVGLGALALLCFVGLVHAYVVIEVFAPPKIIECNKGQAFWCKNITTAVKCGALKHCIKGVWEQEVPIERDTSTVCETCIEMVKEARDQLGSNETQAEIRQVLEASCKVIPIRALRADCDRLMDDFGSYLVDTLASEMNPQVVCSVAGLCNNPAFYQSGGRNNQPAKLTCDSCFGLMEHIEEKIDTASEEDLRTALLSMCSELGSYSDGCGALVLSHLPQIAATLSQNVKALPVCSLAGVCTEKFHSHPKLSRVEIGEEDSDVEVLSSGEMLEKNPDAPSRRSGVSSSDVGEDLPCELCEQLVKHLKDVLIANTTESEFKLVLLGICNQMKENYKNECVQLVESYYDTIYGFLVNELNGKVLCSQIGICPQTSKPMLRPLVPGDLTLPPALQTADMVGRLPLLTPLTMLPKSLLGDQQPDSSSSSLADPRQGSTELCSFCEYFLHFVQQEITLPSSEAAIREVVERGCSKLPQSVSAQCNSFIETYMAAFIALLANRIDPSQVCPGLGLCPGDLLVVEYKDKPTCPLCLLAFEELLRKVANGTEEDINDALDDLCIRDVFPNSLTTECAAFITGYRSSLTDMILAGFTSEEACLYSEVCALPQPFQPAAGAAPEEDRHLTTSSPRPVDNNEISTDRKSDEKVGSNVCIMCEFVMTKLEKMLKDHTTEEEIKATVYKVCNYMPRTVTAQCKQFVQEYADLIIELLSNEISPKEVCTALNLCAKASELILRPVRRCLACEVMMESLKAVMTDEDIDRDFNFKLIQACRRLPTREISTCDGIVRELAPQIEMALRTLPIGPMVCKRIGLCGSPRCAIGPSFWCASKENAILCQEKEFCHANMEKQLTHGKTHLKGTHFI